MDPSIYYGHLGCGSNELDAFLYRDHKYYGPTMLAIWGWEELGHQNEVWKERIDEESWLEIHLRNVEWKKVPTTSLLSRCSNIWL